MDYIEPINQEIQNITPKSEYEQILELKEQYDEYKQQRADLEKKQKVIADKWDATDHKMYVYKDPLLYYGGKETIFDNPRTKITFVILYIVFSPIVSILTIGASLILSLIISLALTWIGPLEMIFQYVAAVGVLIAMLINGLIFLLSITILVMVFVLTPLKARAKRKYKRDKKKIDAELKRLEKLYDEQGKEWTFLDLQLEELDTNFYNQPSIIDSSDYEYIDYIVYLFNTHRVSSLKEALQQIDLEKRSQEMLRAQERMRTELDSSIRTVGQEVRDMNTAVSNAVYSVRNEVEKQGASMNAQIAMGNSIANSKLKVMKKVSEDVESVRANTAEAAYWAKSAADSAATANL